MKAEHREHPLGTPGASARRMAGLQSDLPRWVSKLFPVLLGDAAPWIKGAEGEELVARRLRKLSDDWMPQHDRPLGDRGRNVDHLVIGRGGVFSINTKNLTGRVIVSGNTFKVNGHRERSIFHKARDEGRKVSERLTVATGVAVEVLPVLVVLTPSLDVLSQPDGVQVLGRRDVPRWFEARPHTLDLATANRIYVASRRNDVWTKAISTLRAEASPNGLTANVWRRPGQDRVYVNDATGAALGHLDRKTGEIHVKDVARRDEVQTILAPYLQTT